MRTFERYCDNIENVENYEKAKSDNFKGWLCHHRLETHTSDGERRTVDISPEELKALDMYFHRPANELIFLKRGEHSTLHLKGKPNINKGRHLTEEHKRKLSESGKGKEFSKERKENISKSLKGHPVSSETRRKLAEIFKGKRSEIMQEMMEAYKKSGRKDWNTFQKEYKKYRGE